MNNLIIAYGSKNITLNRGDEHFILTKDELAHIVQSAIRNKEVVLSVTPASQDKELKD
jgi:hypothetical protein